VDSARLLVETAHLATQLGSLQTGAALYSEIVALQPTNIAVHRNQAELLLALATDKDTSPRKALKFSQSALGALQRARELAMARVEGAGPSASSLSSAGATKSTREKDLRSIMAREEEARRITGRLLTK